MYERIVFHRTVSEERLREARQHSLSTRGGKRIYRLAGRRSERNVGSR